MVRIVLLVPARRREATHHVTRHTSREGRLDFLLLLLLPKKRSGSVSPEPSDRVDVPSVNQIGILARRRIEAEMIKPIYDVLVREFGQERAADIIGEAVADAARATARAMASQEPSGATLSSFVALQPLWTKDRALEVDILVEDEDRYHYNVTRCRYAELYREMGLGAIGHLLSCNRDRVFIEGYAPSVHLTRTQTIMGGASHCDFRYDRAP